MTQDLKQRLGERRAPVPVHVILPRPCESCGDPIDSGFRLCEDCAHDAAEDVPPWFLFEGEKP